MLITILSYTIYYVLCMTETEYRQTFVRFCNHKVTCLALSQEKCQYFPLKLKISRKNVMPRTSPFLYDINFSFIVCAKDNFMYVFYGTGRLSLAIHVCCV